MSGVRARLLSLVAIAALVLTLFAPAPQAQAATVRGSTPTITGTVALGQTLTAHRGTWKPSTVHIYYRWLRNGVSIYGATHSTYKLTTADVGKMISVKVTGKKRGYHSTSKTSVRVGPVQPGTIGAGSPTISGTAQVGEKLTAAPGSWTPTGVALSYQWLANGNPIGGATGTTFTPGFNEEGTQVSVRVTGAKSYYTTTSATSAGVAVAAPAHLHNGETLPATKELRSPNGQYSLVMQSDGNLVEYGPSGAVWSTGSNGGDHAVMQGDGNLVVYTAAGAAKWGSGTDGYGSGVTLSLQDDSNLVLYRDGSAVWTRGVVRWLTVGAKAMAGSTPGTQSMSGPTLNSTQYGIYAPNSKVPVVCGTTSGQGVKGAYSTVLDYTWHRTLRGDWVPDADFYTGTNGLFAGEPDCSPSGGGAGATKLDNYVAAHPEGSQVGNGQCVELVKDYLRAVWGLNPGALGNATEYRPGMTGGNYFAAHGWQWHTDQNFQPGDVLVWAQTQGLNNTVEKNGHVAIWWKGSKPLYQQNAWPLTYRVSFGTFFNGGNNVYSGYWRHP